MAREFKEFIRLWQTSHVSTSPLYPQSNGKLQRWHRTLKEQAIRPQTPLSLEQARPVVAEFVEHYNTLRLHSAIGYVTPQAKLEAARATTEITRRAKETAARRSGLQLKMKPRKDNLSIGG